MTAPEAWFAKCFCGRFVGQWRGEPADKCPRHMSPWGKAEDKADAQRAAVAALPPMPAAGPGAFSFRLSGVPVGVNRAYTPSRQRGRPAAIRLTEDAKRWKNYVRLAALAARPRGWVLTGSFELDVHSVFVSPLADRDGPLKLVQDALQGVAYEGDRQVVGGRTTKGQPDGAPRLECTVRRLPEAP